MAPATQRANLGAAGHRMLGHHVGPQSAFANVPPPMNLDRRNNYNDRSGYAVVYNSQRSFDDRGGYQQQNNTHNQTSYDNYGGDTTRTTDKTITHRIETGATEIRRTDAPGTLPGQI
ncbi:hypothetical protein NQ317_001764 [Molorchus minor]|uniref:Uncharacterized protein n=1 Tax=Molorchus minor TaxID=1323400 RepID=A0ABQ9JH15_9CUCU|nr:hypothetical protein NQ317_001764 [Molorchus minor]